jgi:hypothetical protein
MNCGIWPGWCPSPKAIGEHLHRADLGRVGIDEDEERRVPEMLGDRSLQSLVGFSGDGDPHLTLLSVAAMKAPPA